MKTIVIRGNDSSGRNEFGRRVWYEVRFADWDVISKLDQNWKESGSLKAIRKFIRKYDLKDYVIVKRYYQRDRYFRYEKRNGVLIQEDCRHWCATWKIIETTEEGCI